MQRKPWNRWAALMAVLMLAVAPLALSAETDQEKYAEEIEVMRAHALQMKDRLLGLSGMQAWIDPETGQLRMPTEAEARELGEQMRAMMSDPAGYQPMTWELADGTVGAEVSFEHLAFSLVAEDAETGTTNVCVDGPAAARNRLETARVTKTEEK